MDSLNWYCKKFSALSVTELYEIMKLRSEVFVIEQQCIYLDADDKDLASYHLFALQNGSIAAMQDCFHLVSHLLKQVLVVYLQQMHTEKKGTVVY